MLVMPGQFIGGSVGGVRDDFNGLDTIMSGVISQWDASQYAGSGNLLNLVNPANGDDKSAYDLALGGTVAYQDASAQSYLTSADGTGHLVLSGAMTAFLNGLHKNAAASTVGLIFRNSTANSGTSSFISTFGANRL